MPAYLSSFLLSAALILPGTIRGDAPAESTGVVVEDVVEESAAQEAGIQPGDVIVSWSRAPVPPANPQGEEGSIASPFDVTRVEIARP